MLNFDVRPAVRWLKNIFDKIPAVKISAVISTTAAVTIAGVGTAVTSEMYPALINPHDPQHKAAEIIVAGFGGIAAMLGWVATHDVMKAFPSVLRPAERLSARFASVRERISAYIEQHPRAFVIGGVAIAEAAAAAAIEMHNIAPFLTTAGLGVGILAGRSPNRPQGPSA